MDPIQHPYFGHLDADALKKVDVIWDESRTLNDETFDVCLWGGIGSDTSLHTPTLDAFAAFLQDLSARDVFARQQLVKYLEEDPFYIEHHVDEVHEDDEVISQLLTDAEGGKILAPAFVAKMKLTNIGLWLDVSSGPIIMDYMIDPENGDEILAVQLTLDYQIADIAWES